MGIKCGTTNNFSIDNNGAVNMVANGRAWCHIHMPASAVSAPGSQPASQVSHGTNGAYEYSTAQQKYTSTDLVLPCPMDKTYAPKILIYWDALETTGVCRWEMEYIYRQESEDLTLATPDATVAVDSTVSTTANGLVIATFNLAVPGANDRLLIMRLSRNPGHSNDTLTGGAFTVYGIFNFVMNI